ncbi:MAG TPA: helix-turn-helix domain-containing protein [Clostridia bacterium]|nr:helix-turn-helix domain-containing protein [Clostridia bacterium]
MEQNLSKRETNKAKKRAAFLEAARELFIGKGFESTSIEEVVRRAGLTKRTLYQYFLSKEDLYYAVALDGARLLYESSRRALEQGENAREKIRLANLAHLEFYKEHAASFRALNETPSNLENSEESPHYREIRRLDAERMRHIATLMAEGASDGSINPNLDMQKAVLFGFFSAFSMLYTLSCTDKGVFLALGIDEEEFLRFSFDLFLSALK